MILSDWVEFQNKKYFNGFVFIILILFYSSINVIFILIKILNNVILIIIKVFNFLQNSFNKW